MGGFTSITICWVFFSWSLVCYITELIFQSHIWGMWAWHQMFSELVEKKRLGIIVGSTCRFLFNCFVCFSMTPLTQAVCRVLKYRNPTFEFQRRKLKKPLPSTRSVACYFYTFGQFFQSTWSHQFLKHPRVHSPILGLPSSRKFRFLRSTKFITTCCFPASKVLLLWSTFHFLSLTLHAFFRKPLS